MKRLLLCLLIIFYSLAGHAQQMPDWTPLNDEAKRHLINLLNIDTSLPEPDELAAARYIYKEFNKQKEGKYGQFEMKKNAFVIYDVKKNIFKVKNPN